MTHHIIGYGEDGLTYWAISTQLTLLLHKFGDNCPTPSACVFYRPSFGRGTNFGEFDAIIATPTSIYLIECKWHLSGEFKKTRRTVVLTDPQIRRHRYFMRQYNHIAQNCPGPFADPSPNYRSGDQLLTRAPTRLKTNTDHIFLTITSKFGWKLSVRNICLFFTPSVESCHDSKDLTTIPSTVESSGAERLADGEFDMVVINYPRNGGINGFIEMTGPTADGNS